MGGGVVDWDLRAAPARFWSVPGAFMYVRSLRQSNECLLKWSGGGKGVLSR